MLFSTHCQSDECLAQLAHAKQICLKTEISASTKSLNGLEVLFLLTLKRGPGVDIKPESEELIKKQIRAQMSCLSSICKR